MENNLNKILDECIDRTNRGESLEACLSDYPKYADQLEPLLRSMASTRAAYAFTPSTDAMRAGRQRFYAALEKKRRPSIWQQIVSRHAIWATTAGVVAIAIITYFGLKATLFSVEPSGGNIAQPPPGFTGEPSLTSSIEPTTEPGSNYIIAANINGNFSFLVSDEVNAISDFSVVKVTVDRVGILQSGESGRWQEFTPEVKEFDLSLLPGDKTLELWRGDVPDGEYNKVFIYVSSVTGILKSTGETIDIKLPSSKLQISHSFQVSANNVTSFTYDLTVVDTGNSKKADKYQIKPQIGESGACQRPLPKYTPENNKKAPNSPDTLTPTAVNNNRKK